MPRSIRSLTRLLRASLLVFATFLVGAAGILSSAPRVAEAAAPTAITYSGSAANTGLANTPTTWTVGFTSTASGALAAGGTITVQFHSAFTVPTGPVAVTLSSAFVGCTGTATGAGSTVTVTQIGRAHV